MKPTKQVGEYSPESTQPLFCSPMQLKKKGKRVCLFCFYLRLLRMSAAATTIIAMTATAMAT